MPHANPEQLRNQEARREQLRRGIVSHLSKQPRLLKLWLTHQPIAPSMSRREPDSIVAVANINADRLTSLRTIDYGRLRKGDTQWLSPQELHCPNTGMSPEEATLFCIIAEPTLKAIALTTKGWNDCWVLQQTVDDDEENDELSPLKPIEIAAAALGNLPYKAVLTPPANLVSICPQTPAHPGSSARRTR